MSDDRTEIERLLEKSAIVMDEMQTALAKAKPKVEAYDSLMHTEESVTVSAASKILGWSGPIKEFRKWLIDTHEIFVEWDSGLRALQYKPCKQEKSHVY